MAKPVFKSVLDNAAGDDWQAATGSSSAVDVSECTDITVTLFGTFVATVFVDVSMDGTNFAPWGSLTAPGAYTKIPACKAFKMRTSAYTSGTPKAACSALRETGF
jgi:hypothetical protein